MAKVNVVIGGAGGIGMSVAGNLNKDEIVLITGMNQEDLCRARDILKSCGREVETAVCDITDDDSLKALVDKTKELGSLNSVINSAGVSGAEAGIELVLKVDLAGTERVINAFEEIAEEGSTAIMIASMMGSVVPDKEEINELLLNPLEEGSLEKIAEIVRGDSNLAYNFAKKGVRLLVKKHCEAWGAKGARIVSISPGIIMTPMAEQAAAKYPEQMENLKNITPAGRLGKPEDIADVVKFLISREGSFITGSDILVDGGLANNLHKMQR